MPITAGSKDKVRRHIFGSASWTKPSQLWLGLLLATPDDPGGIVEVSAPSYARVRRDPGDTNWTFPAGTGEANNTAPVTFADPTESWGQAKGVGMWDQDGLLMSYNNLVSPKDINAGDQGPTFPAGTYKFIIR